MSFFICIPLCLLFFLRSTLAVFVNVTVDDTFGDNTTNSQIQYNPINSWVVGGSCDDCSTPPDGSLASENTWQYSQFSRKTGNVPLTATVHFHGSAVSVHCILASSARSDMTFLIDGQVAGVFNQDPVDGPTNYQYNIPVFAVAGLASTPHNLTITNGRPNGRKASVFLDSVTYTFDNALQYGDVTLPSAQPPDSTTNDSDGSPSSGSGLSASADIRSPSKSSRVLGGVLGTLFGLLFIGVAFYIYRRYYRYPKVLQMSNSQKNEKKWFDRFFPIPRREDSRDLPTTGISFNPDMLVRRPSDPLHPRNGHGYVIDPPPAPWPSSSQPTTPQPPPTANLSTSRWASIQAWQKQTHREAKGVPVVPPDMSEELESYYDDNGTESHRVRTPPPPVRHFTVVNK